MSIIFVTGNENKLKEVRAILGEGITNRKLDLPEIQSMNLEEILRAKVRAAFKEIAGPVLVEDISYEIEAVNGFPGPFVKFWEKLGLHDTVLTNIEKSGNAKSRVIAGAAYKDAEREIVIFETLHGKHVKRSGGEGWGFDFYFIPDGETETFAQMGFERKNILSHRGKALRAMKERLLKEGILL